MTMIIASLPWNELQEVLEDEEPERFIVGAILDTETSLISFTRGSGEMFTMPLSIFEISGDGTVPNFAKLAIIDYGQSVAFGEYEAASDAIFEDYERIKKGESNE